MGAFLAEQRETPKTGSECTRALGISKFLKYSRSCLEHCAGVSTLVPAPDIEISLSKRCIAESNSLVLYGAHTLHMQW